MSLSIISAHLSSWLRTTAISQTSVASLRGRTLTAVNRYFYITKITVFFFLPSIYPRGNAIRKVWGSV